MERALTLFRAFLGILGVIIFALGMKGLKLAMETYGVGVGLGFMAGFALATITFWSYEKMTGRSMLTEHLDAEFQKPKE